MRKTKARRRKAKLAPTIAEVLDQIDTLLLDVAERFSELASDEDEEEIDSESEDIATSAADARSFDFDDMQDKAHAIRDEVMDLHSRVKEGYPKLRML